MPELASAVTPKDPPDDQMRILTHPSMLRHAPGDDHPESPLRLKAILDELAGRRLVQPERRATRAELCLAHDAEHVDRVLVMTDGGALDHETFLSVNSADAAAHAVGIVLFAIDQLACAGGATFAVVRPPGHHAGRSGAMGYCIFNNVAIGVLHALQTGFARVAVIDWDAHHGNGTQAILGDRAEVCIVDVHQCGLFPVGTGGPEECGRGAGLKNTRNVPLPEGAGDADVLRAIDSTLPFVRAFDPRLIVVSAGFDAHWSDPQAALQMTTDGFGALAGRVKTLADELRAPLLFVLEGGYDPLHLARNVRRCVDLLEHSVP